MQEFKVGDKVVLRRGDKLTENFDLLIGCVYTVSSVSGEPRTSLIGIKELGEHLAEWDASRFELLVNREVSSVRQEDTCKQISIERVGDKTSVTISGHLTKDDVHLILNLIF